MKHDDKPANLAAFLMIAAAAVGADYQTFAAALALLNAAAADLNGPATLAAELSHKDCGEAWHV